MDDLDRNVVPSYNKYTKYRAGWRQIGEKRAYYRSKWEANYARYLEILRKQNIIQSWEHEPKTFWFESIKRGTRSYLPDFKIINLDGTHYWVEVKGFMDAKSKTKIKRFRKYYPEENLEIKDSAWYKKNAPKLKTLCIGWE